MNLSRFFGSTNREALRQVRMALGPGAFIVSNRRVNGGVEIMATDDTSLPAAAQDADSNVIGAIGEMRGALETRIDEVLWGSLLRRAPQAVDLFQTMLGYGFSTALLRAMLKRLPENLSSKAAFQWARNELITHLPVLSDEDGLWVPGVALALVGPTGVGKTTTIAKLAALCTKRFGPQKVTLLTTDTYRIGAHEQLKIYGRMMQLAVHIVQDAGELFRIVQRLGADQTILIDNVGISQRDQYVTEQASMLAAAGRPVKRILVLNASSNGDTLDEVARSYFKDGGNPLAGCIITKLDEATRLAAALDTAIRYQLPIHYVSNGQKVPEDLLFLPAEELVDQALARSPRVPTLYSPTGADFAALLSLIKVPEPDSGAAEHRRKQLLPDLLRAVGSGNFTLLESDLKKACLFIDDDPACSEAFDLWRAHVASSIAPPTQMASLTENSVGASIDQLLRRVPDHLAGVQHSWVLAVHDGASLTLRDGARARLRATALMTDRGQALISPVQQLALADGWRSSCGAADLAAPRSNDALYHQIQWLDQRCEQLPLVHVFNSAAPALQRRLSTQGISWLMQGSGASRIKVDSSPTTLSAASKTLAYRPLEQLAGRVQLAEFEKGPIGRRVFWVASALVESSSRQTPAPVTQLVSVRVVDRRDGVALKTLYGLSNLLPAAIEPDLLAAWLIVQYDLAIGFRYAANFWPLLIDGEQPPTMLQKKVLTAMQLGLAAWQIRHAGRASEARAVMRGLAGKPVLTARTAASVMLKLFALKEMLA